MIATVGSRVDWLAAGTVCLPTDELGAQVRMTDQANDTVASKTSGAAVGLGIGAVLGLAAIPFVKSEAPVEGVVMLVGALIGIAAD